MLAAMPSCAVSRWVSRRQSPLCSVSMCNVRLSEPKADGRERNVLKSSAVNPNGWSSIWLLGPPQLWRPNTACVTFMNPHSDCCYDPHRQTIQSKYGLNWQRIHKTRLPQRHFAKLAFYAALFWGFSTRRGVGAVAKACFTPFSKPEVDVSVWSCSSADIHHTIWHASKTLLDTSRSVWYAMNL